MTAEVELQAVATSVDASEEQSDSENTGARGKVKRQQMDHIAEKGCVGSCHCGSVHELVLYSRRMGKQLVHFVNLMDLCHLKNVELAKHLQKYGVSYGIGSFFFFSK